MGIKETLNSAVESIYPRIVKYRRTIHQNPELSGEEYKTAAFVFEKLMKLGLNPSFCVRKTGVTATIENGEGSHIVLRADMDALPIDELNDIPFKSQKNGVMHACGHDVHTSSLLGAAEVLLKIKDHWKGKVTLLFQPSEEVEPGGAFEMINEGVFPEDASAVFGLHVSEYETGTIAMKSGADYSGILVFDVTVKGKGGHGAMPHTTVDPIVCAATMITELQTLISRECPPFEPAVLTVGTIHAGTKRNIIPDEAIFQGTIRTFSDNLQEHLHTRVTDILDSVARSFRANVDVIIEKSYPSGYNNPELTKEMLKQFSDFLGKENVIKREEPTMFSEDFAYFQKKVPGLYIHLGVKDPKNPSSEGIHSARFLPQEESIKTAIKSHVIFTLGRLGI